MHELSLIEGVLDAAEESARQAGASHVTKVSLRIGEMAAVVPDALEFAFEALIPNTIFDGCELECTYVPPKSVCLSCGAEFEHDRFHNACPQCGSLACKLIAGREMDIDSIEVEIPEEGSEEAARPLPPRWDEGAPMDEGERSARGE